MEGLGGGLFVSLTVWMMWSCDYQDQIDAVTEQPLPRRPWRTAAIAIAVILVIVAAAAAVYLASRPSDTTSPRQPDKTIRIVGYLTLQRGQFIWDKNPPVCNGYKGYDDLKQGTQIVITDPAGTTIALAQLPIGEPLPDPTDNTRAAGCRFHFTVDVPDGHQFYGIEIAHRGRQTRNRG